MTDLVWNSFSKEKQDEYIRFLKIFGALSGLFKDNLEGANARKPFLYYRNHEQLYARIFDVEDLTRKDSAFDALAIVDGKKMGIGLKTWIHSKDLSYQKVAEFNKVAPSQIYPLINEGSPNEVMKKVSELRNERILMDKRLHGTALGDDRYHYITRSNNAMNICETNYDLVQLDTLKLIESNGKTFHFTDGVRRYRFYSSKSVLLESFDASEKNIITTVPIKQFDNPFELIQTIELPYENFEVNSKSDIILPLYSYLGSKKRGDKRIDVPRGGGINKWHREKESNRPWDVEIRIPKWVHQKFSGWFFGHDFIKTEDRVSEQQEQYKSEHVTAMRIRNEDSVNYVPFILQMPDGRQIDASVNGANGKNLQSKSSKDLGYWLLHTVIGVPRSVMDDPNSESVVTLQKLQELDIDSIRLKMIDEKNRIIGIDVAEYGAFELFSEKNDHSEVLSSVPDELEE